MDESTQEFLCNISIQNSRLPINFIRKVKKSIVNLVYMTKNISKKGFKRIIYEYR